MLSCRSRRTLAAALVALVISSPIHLSAYSVLAHEAVVDALWDSNIRPLLARRFPRATREDLQSARAYAYGGSVIQDLGYYPFGSHFFSNLLHYVRSGDFVETLFRDARDVDELAFATGALAHYVADSIGHPEAVNKSVPLLFPKLEAKFGDDITYVEARSQHVITEFSFDIVQIAGGAYLPDTYHGFIGFEVAKPLLERAFREVYGLEMKDVFADEDLAIGTYRKSVSDLIPEFTRIAWKDKHDEIARLTPGIRENAFIYTLTREQYEREFGTGYHKAGIVARIIAFLYRLLPKIGPLKPLSFKTPTPEAQRLFEASFRDVRARCASVLAGVARSSVDMRNINLDIGARSARGAYRLADETFAELVNKLGDHHYAGVTPALREEIVAFYRHGTTPTTRKERRSVARIEAKLDEMIAASR